MCRRDPFTFPDPFTFRGSRMTATYVHMSGRDVDGALLRLAGIRKETKENQKKSISPRKCRRCNHINTETAKFCEKCLLALETENTQKFEKKLEPGQDLMNLLMQDSEFRNLLMKKFGEVFARQFQNLPQEPGDCKN